MLNSEPRLLMSDSIKDDVGFVEETNTVVSESQIAILILLEKKKDSGIITILRGTEINELNLKLSFVANSADAIKILLQFHEGLRDQFESAAIDFRDQINKINLSAKKMTSFLIKEIDNDKQTSNCEIIFS